MHTAPSDLRKNGLTIGIDAPRESRSACKALRIGTFGRSDPLLPKFFPFEILRDLGAFEVGFPWVPDVAFVKPDSAVVFQINNHVIPNTKPYIHNMNDK